MNLLHKGVINIMYVLYFIQRQYIS